MSVLYNPSNESLYTREQLHQLPVPAPLGRFHNPIPFGDFADAVAYRCEAFGLEVVSDEYAVSHNGNRFFGVLEIGFPEVSSPDWSLQIGVRGSHDQTLPRGLTLGSRVLVCSNLCFHGELGTFHTRQTTHVQERLPDLISRAVEKVPSVAQRNLERFDAYRKTPLTRRDGDATLVELLRRGALSPSQLARARLEWDEPSFEAHAEDGLTAWRLFNACTQALKPTGESVNHDLVRQRSLGISQCLDEVVAL
jgi:hypothetical protein